MLSHQCVASSRSNHSMLPLLSTYRDLAAQRFIEPLRFSVGMEPALRKSEYFSF